jgi:hypothetical protein
VPSLEDKPAAARIGLVVSDADEESGVDLAPGEARCIAAELVKLADKVQPENLQPFVLSVSHQARFKAASGNVCRSL